MTDTRNASPALPSRHTGNGDRWAYAYRPQLELGHIHPLAQLLEKATLELLSAPHEYESVYRLYTITTTTMNK